MNFPVVILGGGGHARVLMEVLSRQGTSLLGITDIEEPPYLPEGIAWLGGDEAISNLDQETIQLVNGLGSSYDTRARSLIYEQYTKKGYRFASVVHPDVTLSTQNLQLGAGVQIMAGVVVNPHSHIGDNVLLNTRSVIEHDCRIGKHTHIASGAIICGGCKIGDGVHIGAGSTIIQGIKIGSGAIIAAGSVVIKNVKPMTMVAGVPCKVMRTLHDD